MKALKLEEFDDFYGNILASVTLIRQEEFEACKHNLLKETNELPVCFQHRIAFMRQYVEDFDVRFWAQILKCCQAALKICQNFPDSNFKQVTTQDLDDLTQTYDLNRDEKAFAFTLAIAKISDETNQKDFDSSLVMNVPDPWPINPLGSHLHAREIVIYKNSDEYARIERLNNRIY